MHRVLIVNSYGANTRVGGTEKHVRRFAQGLEAFGWEPIVLQAYPSEVETTCETITLHATDQRRSERRRVKSHLGDALSLEWPVLSRVLRQVKPAVVNTHNLGGIGTGVWGACQRRGVNVVHSVHDFHLECPRVTLMSRELIPCRCRSYTCGLRTASMMRHRGAVTVVTAGTEFALARHRALFENAEHVVIPNPFLGQDAVDVRRTPSPEAPRSIGYLGALTREKGVDLLVAAAPMLAGAGIAVRFAGHGPLASAVKVLAERHRGIEFHGVVQGSEKWKFIEACDVGLMPSVWPEPGGPPNALLEWLEAGRPVLASSRGCLRDAIRQFRGVMEIPLSADGLTAVCRGLGGSARRDLREAVATIDTSWVEDEWLARFVELFETQRNAGGESRVAERSGGSS